MEMIIISLFSVMVMLLSVSATFFKLGYDLGKEIGKRK